MKEDRESGVGKSLNSFGPLCPSLTLRFARGCHRSDFCCKTIMSKRELKSRSRKDELLRSYREKGGLKGERGRGTFIELTRREGVRKIAPTVPSFSNPLLSSERVAKGEGQRRVARRGIIIPARFCRYVTFLLLHFSGMSRGLSYSVRKILCCTSFTYFALPSDLRRSSALAMKSYKLACDESSAHYSVDETLSPFCTLMKSLSESFPDVRFRSPWITSFLPYLSPAKQTRYIWTDATFLMPI